MERESHPVGRNQPCPCGSGKKFKKCCFNRTEQPTGLLELFALCNGVRDEAVAWKLNIGRGNKLALRDPEFWNELGCDLGSLGLHERARQAFEGALRINSNHADAMLNLAVTLGMLGQNDEALDLITRIPESTRRYSVIKANLLRNLGEHDLAIPFYERAIAEEPSFDLPYVNLCECLRLTANPLFDVWLERAVGVVKNSPSLAAKWTRHLFRTDRFADLASADWVDAVTPRVGDPGIVGRLQKDPVDVSEAQLWRACGQLVAQPTLEQLKRTMDFESKYRALGGGCDPSRVILSTAINLGEKDLAETIYQNLCASCRELLGGLEFILASCAVAKEQWAEAASWSEKHLANTPHHIDTLSIYWWALDELGKADEALMVAEELYQIMPGTENLIYNLGFLAGKAGQLGKSDHYYREVLQKEPYHPYALENQMVIQALNGDFEEGQKSLAKRVAELNGWASESGDGEDAREIAEKIKSLEFFLNEAMRSFGSSSYLKDLISFRSQLVPGIGSDLAIPRKPLPISQTLALLSSADTAVRAEAIQRMKARQQGDYSDILVTLQGDLPGFEGLPLETRQALFEAERRLIEGGTRDYSLEVVAYAKAVEVALKAFVFDAFKSQGLASIDISVEIQIALQDRFKQAITFVRYIERGPYIELGGMIHALRLTGGRTARELGLLGMFRSFICEHLNLAPLLQKPSIEALEELLGMRNPAAHATSADESTARKARENAVWVLTLLAPIRSS